MHVFRQQQAAGGERPEPSEGRGGGHGEWRQSGDRHGAGGRRCSGLRHVRPARPVSGPLPAGK